MSPRSRSSMLTSARWTTSGPDRAMPGLGRGGGSRPSQWPAAVSAPPDVRERITVGVPAAVVYAALSDVRRMGEWSPECVGATPADPDAAPVPGMSFAGHNRIGRWRSWTTECTVTVADHPRCFAFDVSLRGVVASWRFDLVASPDGHRTEVIQSWWDRRGPARRCVSAVMTGVRDRASHNRGTMRLTLLRLKKALES